MTERERRFVEAFMGEACGNATTAARLAGYSPIAARTQGSRLLSKGNIRSAIEARRDTDPLILDREQRQSFWTQVVRDPELPMRDRLKASELLARSQGDFIEKRLLQLEGSGHLTLAELIAGVAPPTAPRAPAAWETPRAPVVVPEGPQAATPAGPSTGVTAVPSVTASPVRAPDNAAGASTAYSDAGRSHRWGGPNPGPIGPSTADTDYDPYRS